MIVPDPTPRILVAEDDDAIRGLLIAAIRREGFQVDGAPDGLAALERTRQCEYAVILLDLMMPTMNGFDFLVQFHAATPKPRSVIIVVTAFDESKVAKLGAEQVHAVIRKPFDVGQLVALVREAGALWVKHTSTPLSESPGASAAQDSDTAAPDVLN